MTDSVLVTQSAPHRFVVTLCGEVDLVLRAQLADANARIAHAVLSAVHLDLRLVTFFSADGLGFLAELLDTVSRDDAALTVGPIPRCVRRAMEITDLDLMDGVDGGQMAEGRDAQYGASGGLWDALTADFSAEEQTNIRQTVVGAAQRQRAAAHDGDQDS